MRMLGLLLFLTAACLGQTSATALYNLVVRGTMPVSFTGAADLGDFNGDGRPDLIGEVLNGYRIHLNDGAGSFSANAVTYPSVTVPPGAAYFSLFVVADFNSDGYADVVNLTGAGTYFLAGDGRGGLAKGRQVAIDTKGNPMNLVAADFNGDGFLDIAYGNFGGGLRVFLGSGTGEFRELVGAFTEKLPDPANPRIQVSDLNGDGAPDVIMIDLLPRTIAILLNDGTGHFHASQVVQRGRFSRPDWIAVGDFDHDGKPEMAISYFVVDGATSIHYNLELWKLDASGQYAPVNTFATDFPSRGTMLTADLDGDGNLDVIAGGNAETTVYFGDGAGGFGRKTVLPAGGQPFVADLDGDGRPEIVVASRQAVSVLGVRGSLVLLSRDAPNPFSYGQLENFTVSVASDPKLGGFPTGGVALFDGARAAGTMTLTNGVARFVVPFVAGVHVYHAIYSGDAFYGAGSADLVVAEAGQPATIKVLPTEDFLGLKIFSLTVRDAFGSPVRGVGVIFTVNPNAPGGSFLGSSTVTVITGADGVATAPWFLQNGVPGSYKIRVAISGYPSVTGEIGFTNPK